MQKMKMRFKELPIRTVLTILLFPFFLLLMICCVSFYISGVTHYTSMVKENAQSLVTQSRNSLNQDIANIQESAESLLDERVFYSMETNIEEGKDPIEPVDYLQLSTGFTNFLQHYSTYVDSMGLWLSDNSIYYYQSNTGSSISILRSVDYAPYLGEEDLTWVSTSQILPDSIIWQLPYHFAMIKSLGTSDSSVNGVFLVGVRDETFFYQIQNSRPTPNSKMALMRKNGELIEANATAEEGNTMLDLLGESGVEEIRKKIGGAKDGELLSFNIEDYYVIYTPTDMKDTGILAVIPEDELYINAREFTHIFVFLAFIVIILFVTLYFVIPRYFSGPVTKLLDQMEKIREPSGERRIAVSGYREISQIGNGVNEMMGRIQNLTESIQREMQAKQATQLQYLFAQINPHFLYNTLDCIKELCACNENEKAEEMIEQLAVFYRIGVSKGKSYIPLEDELKHVSAYLSILQTRFEDFQFFIELPEELKSACVLRMILQPIVENAVYHGIRPYRTDGTVRIAAVKKGGNVEIHVKDDGGGVAEDILMKVRKSLDEPICEYSEKSYGVYGLKNVQDRIQIAYGKQYKIRVEMEIDCGTEVILTIPYEEEHR